MKIMRLIISVDDPVILSVAGRRRRSPEFIETDLYRQHVQTKSWTKRLNRNGAGTPVNPGAGVYL